MCEPSASDAMMAVPIGTGQSLANCTVALIQSGAHGTKRTFSEAMAGAGEACGAGGSDADGATFQDTFDAHDRSRILTCLLRHEAPPSLFYASKEFSTNGEALEILSTKPVAVSMLTYAVNHDQRDKLGMYFNLGHNFQASWYTYDPIGERLMSLYIMAITAFNFGLCAFLRASGAITAAILDFTVVELFKLMERPSAGHHHDAIQHELEALLSLTPAFGLLKNSAPLSMAFDGAPWTYGLRRYLEHLDIASLKANQRDFFSRALIEAHYTNNFMNHCEANECFQMIANKAQEAELPLFRPEDIEKPLKNVCYKRCINFRLVRSMIFSGAPVDGLLRVLMRSRMHFEKTMDEASFENNEFAMLTVVRHGLTAEDNDDLHYIKENMFKMPDRLLDFFYVAFGHDDFLNQWSVHMDRINDSFHVDSTNETFYARDRWSARRLAECQRVCRYMLSKFPPEQLLICIGLWSFHPKIVHLSEWLASKNISL